MMFIFSLQRYMAEITGRTTIQFYGINIEKMLRIPFSHRFHCYTKFLDGNHLGLSVGTKTTYLIDEHFSSIHSGFILFYFIFMRDKSLNIPNE